MKKNFTILLVALAYFISGFAQSDVGIKNNQKSPNNWFQLDEGSSGFPGISLEKAYTLIKSKNLKSTRIIVAVIDSGIDTLHEDLKAVLWTNPKEIPGNGIDDDHNGYIDDVHGWNFLGGKDGRNVIEDSYEASRVYFGLKPTWENWVIDTNKLTINEKSDYNIYLKAKSKLSEDIDPEEISALRMMLPKMLSGDSIIRKELGKKEYTAADLKDYNSNNLLARITSSIIVEISKDNNTDDITNKELIDELKDKVRRADAVENAPSPLRKEIVQDDETNINDRFYGNNDIMTSSAFHGTHCSGIIAADRNNHIGINGIADNVSIMMIRAIPDGDEHDKDIANAICYAVDNGARIISMSFGKSFSPQKQWVDDAIRYADAHGVLIVQASGNDSKNIDSTDNFPNAVYLDGKGKAGNIITVSASGNKINGGLTAYFSNYGKNNVDVFAPGVGIYSCIPGGNTYGTASGTSMACPVVAGIAALILEHYPTFTAKQIKFIIEKSVIVPKEKVKIPGTEKMVPMNELSRSGGIVNAYEAIKLAGTIKTNKTKEDLPKPKIKKVKLD